MNNEITGACGINPRVATGAFIKHIRDLSDRETILEIQENIYMQYFIGFSSYSDEAVFDSSLFVNLRKRIGPLQLNEINKTRKGVMDANKDVDVDTHNKLEDAQPKKENQSAENIAPGDSIENEGNSASMKKAAITATAVVPLSKRRIISGCHGLPARHKIPYR